MSKIQIFVMFGMSGRGTATFDVTIKTSVKDFMQQVVDKEGAEGVRIIFGGKQLTEKRNGRLLTLEDYGLYNEATCHAALRLRGGATLPEEGIIAARFDDNKVKKCGGTIVTTDCIYGISNGCYESNFKKCQLNCGCIYCADCMKHYINAQITVGLNVIIHCGDTSHGNNELNVRLAYEVASFSNAEKKEKDEILSKNLFRRADSSVSVCPNGKCLQYVMKNGCSAKQRCDACQKYMCWNCKKSHKGTQEGCGNDGCDPIVYITLLLSEAKLTTINGYDKQVTDTRLCPNCYEVNVHNSGCRKMTCNGCKFKYCHVCCAKWDAGCSYSNKCDIAPEQKITKDMLKKK